jgi:hypothetical protein
MIGLGKSSAQEMKALSRELGQARTRFKELDAAISQGKLTDSIRYRHELARQEVADVERLIAQRKRLLEIDGRTAAIRARASTLKSEGMSGLMGTMMFAAPAAMAVMHEASAYQREMARIDALGLGKGVVAQADRFARSAHIIGNSTRDMAHAYGDAMAIFKNTHEADFVAPIIGKMHFANKALYGEEGGEHDQALQSLMKTIEYRGGTKSEAAFCDRQNMPRRL